MSALDRLSAKARKATDRMLGEDEVVLTVIAGKSQQALIVTDSRVLVIKPGLLAGAGLGAKASSYPYPTLSSVNVYTGPRVAAIELVPIGESPKRKTDLRAAYQKPNWLPCDPVTSSLPVITELKTLVQSGGRSRSARAALTEESPLSDESNSR